MSEHLELVTLADGADAAAWCAERRDRSVLVAPTLPGGFNAGDVIRRTSAFQPEPAALAVEHVEAEPVAEGGGRPGGSIYRVALFAATREPTPERVAAFEADLVALGEQVGAILRWRLCRVAAASGSAPWTHVWEQEFRALEGLTGSYMQHPAHWGAAERWFDPEHPEWLVLPHLCHAFCAVDGPAW